MSQLPDLFNLTAETFFFFHHTPKRVLSKLYLFHYYHYSSIAK